MMLPFLVAVAYSRCVYDKSTWTVTISGANSAPAKCWRETDVVKVVVIKDDVTFLPDGYFKSMKSLEVVNFGKSSSLARIGESCFLGCAHLKGIIIPGSVRIIGRAAFQNCVSLQHVEYLGYSYFDRSLALFSPGRVREVFVPIGYKYATFSGIKTTARPNVVPSISASTGGDGAATYTPAPSDNDGSDLESDQVSDIVSDEISDVVSDFESDPISEVASDFEDVVSDVASDFESDPISEVASDFEDVVSDVASDFESDPISEVASDFEDVVSDVASDFESDPISEVASDFEDVVSDVASDFESDPISEVASDFEDVVSDVASDFESDPISEVASDFIDADVETVVTLSSSSSVVQESTTQVSVSDSGAALEQSSSKGASSKLQLVGAISGSFVLIALIIVGGYILFRKRRGSSAPKTNYKPRRGRRPDATGETGTLEDESHV